MPAEVLRFPRMKQPGGARGGAAVRASKTVRRRTFGPCAGAEQLCAGAEHLVAGAEQLCAGAEDPVVDADLLCAGAEDPVVAADRLCTSAEVVCTSADLLCTSADLLCTSAEDPVVAAEQLCAGAEDPVVAAEPPVALAEPFSSHTAHGRPLSRPRNSWASALGPRAPKDGPRPDDQPPA